MAPGSARHHRRCGATAGLNVVATIQGIKDQLPALAASLPAAAELHIVGDRTQTIHASVNGVQITLLITIALVVMVIFAFLRNPRSTLIPSLTIPLSLIATFAAMYLLGYSLDNVSLMGLTIAVGFVVDDAIVVIENITRHIEVGQVEGADRRQGSQLHHRLDDRLADRGVHPHPADGRSSGACSASSRSRQRRGCGVRRCVADRDADAVRLADQPP